MSDNDVESNNEATLSDIHRLPVSVIKVKSDEIYHRILKYRLLESKNDVESDNVYNWMLNVSVCDKDFKSDIVHLPFDYRCPITMSNRIMYLYHQISIIGVR
jgi:hypothetical protein